MMEDVNGLNKAAQFLHDAAGQQRSPADRRAPPPDPGARPATTPTR